MMAKKTKKPKAKPRHDRAAIIEECAKCVPMNWCDVLLTGPTVPRGDLKARDVEQLLRGIQDRIRALQQR